MSLTTDENGAVTLSKARHEFCIQVVYELEALAFVLANVGPSCKNDATVALFAVRGISHRYSTLASGLLSALDDACESSDDLSAAVGVNPIFPGSC